MPVASSNADALALATRLLPHVGKVNPFSATGKRFDLADVVHIVRWQFGDAAARSVHIPVH